MLLRVAAVACACVLGAASAVCRGTRARTGQGVHGRQAVRLQVFRRHRGHGPYFFGRFGGRHHPAAAAAARRASPTLPPGTIQVEGTSVCAHLAGVPIEPCFKVQKIDYRSFRGSISGLGFAYCDFPQHNPRAQIIARAIGTAADDADRDIARRDRRVESESSKSVHSGFARFAAIRRMIGHSRSSRNGIASSANSPRPIVSIAATMRPSRPSRRSASDTMRMFGVAVGEARRKASAMLVLVAMRIERADGGIGARGRAADAGIAVHHQRRAAIPAAHEFQTDRRRAPRPA